MICQADIDRASAVAAAAVGSRPSELWSNVRLPEYCHARWAVMVALQDRHPSLSHWHIAKALGRDARGAKYSINQGRALRERDPAFARLVERVKAA